MEMALEDLLKSVEDPRVQYTRAYLTERRAKLMEKITQYRQRLEDCKSNSARITYKHRQQLARIRSFYQNLLHAPTRGAKLVKAVRSTSDEAVKVMKELGLKYKYDGHSYVVYE